MKKIGIICEYNPFHNGHIYHLEKIKELYKDSLIVLVMSSSFTQRGDMSILSKWEKTNIALEYGIDLVVELPFIFASQSADIFAKGAISILKQLQVDTIVFGSESCDVNKFINIANIQLQNNEYGTIVKKYLDKGLNYPTAMSKALKKICGNTITSPNDLLGLSYTKEIIRQNANIEIVPIQRTNDFHDTNLSTDIVSASAIRKNLNSKDISKYVPKITYDYLKKKKENNNYFNFLKYKILTEQANINQYQTVDEGIENRIIKYISKCNSKDELIEKIKTKRYTYNKLNRMFTHILCSLTKEEANNQEIKYIRVLGFNKNGQKYLNEIKKQLDIILITNVEKKHLELLEIENRTDAVYNLINNIDSNEIKPIIKSI